MDELESRLEHELSGLARVPLADPVPVTDLRRRARRMRVARTLTAAVAVATAAVLVGAVVIGSGSHSTPRQKLQVAAPSFVLGDIDAVVLSSGFDADGARTPVPPSLAEKIAKVAGVQSVSGVIDTFAPVARTFVDGQNEPLVPPRSPILFSYHQDDAVHIVEGRAPAAADEIVVDADFVSRNHTALGKTVSLQLKQDRLDDFHIVGTFDLPGIDLTGIPLAAMSAAHQPPQVQLDRIDVNLDPGADRANVRDAISIAIGDDYKVVAPSVISFADQRLAQVEIQHAYWALLSPDDAERTTSGVGPESVQEKTNYAKYADLANHVELRVENVTFLSEDAAALTYRIYYGGGPSPIINDAQSGTATRVKGHWELGKSTLCSLAALVGLTCKATDHVNITPPNGYQPPATLEPEVLQAFATMTNPHATVAERVAAVTGGEALRKVIEAGVNRDRSVGNVHFTIAGWRALSPTNIEILYNLTTSGPSTPWPSTGQANKGADGRWRTGQQYACGISGLAGNGCYTASDSTGATPPPVGSTETTPGVRPTVRIDRLPDGGPDVSDGETPTTAVATTSP